MGRGRRRGYQALFLKYVVEHKILGNNIAVDL